MSDYYGLNRITVMLPGNQFSRHTVQSLMQTADFFNQVGIEFMTIFGTGSNIYDIRNRMLGIKDGNICYGQDTDALLFIDSDQLFKAQDVGNLIHAKKDVIGALISVDYAEGEETRLNAGIFQENGKIGWLLAQNTWPSKLVEVDVIGLGLTLIKAEAMRGITRLAAMNKRRPFDPIYNGTYYHGEDVSLMIRLKNAGYQICAHTDCHVGHVKERII